MNTRTTIMLAVVLVVLSLGYLWRPVPNAGTASSKTQAVNSDAGISKNVINPALGEIVTIKCQRRDAAAPWVFERSKEGGSSAVWRLTSPIKAKAVRWEVDRIVRQLTNLKYEIVYRANTDGAILAEQAGLNPPFATVTLTDDKDGSATIEIGGPQSTSATYVRLAGSDDIYVGMTSLGQMIKKQAIDYRDQQLWQFDTTKAVRIEITDRADPNHPLEYAFVKHGSGWQMEKPAVTKATNKVTDMLREMARVRMTSWVDNRPNQLAGYGLEQAELTARVTVLEDMAAEKANADQDAEEVKNKEKAPSKPQSKEKTYVLHLSNRSPIGENTRVYARAGDESAVGSIMKTTADKFRPVVNEWRDMRITDAETARATRIELTTSPGQAILVKRDGGWWFEADDRKADDGETASLLKAMASLKAVAFVDREAGDSTDYGFASPQARYLLTLPDSTEPEQITIGHYTNAKTKRLVYVLRNDQSSVGKVRVSDVVMLTRTPKAYLDKSIVRVAASQITSLSVSTDNPYTTARRNMVLSRANDEWRMTKPIEAALQQNKATDLVNVLADLSAQAVVGDADQLSAYGLHAPAVTVTLKYKTSDGHTEAINLAFADLDGQVYAKRTDRNDIYQVAPTLLDQLKSEFRLEDVLTFDETKVTSFAVSIGGVEHHFDRKDDHTWIYGAEPDLPLDKAKVDALLLRLKDLKTKRYVAYDVTDLAEFGLAQPAYRATIKLVDGKTTALAVSSQATKGTSDQGYFALIEGSKDVFILPPDTPARMKVDLAELESGS